MERDNHDDRKRGRSCFVYAVGGWAGTYRLPTVRLFDDDQNGLDRERRQPSRELSRAEAEQLKANKEWAAYYQGKGSRLSKII